MFALVAKSRLFQEKLHYLSFIVDVRVAALFPDIPIEDTTSLRGNSGNVGSGTLAKQRKGDIYHQQDGADRRGCRGLTQEVVAVSNTTKLFFVFDLLAFVPCLLVSISLAVSLG